MGNTMCMDSATPLVARVAAGALDAAAQHDGPDPRLRTDENVPDGIRRIAGEQLIDARYILSKLSLIHISEPTRPY